MDNSLVEDPSLVDIKYVFDFKKGASKNFDTHVDLMSNTPVHYTKNTPAWGELDFHKCPHCPLSSGEHKYCPGALSIADIVEYFSANPLNNDEVKCTVIFPDKQMMCEKPVYEPISSLIGLRFATSLCPILREFKLMVRFHEPFSSPFCTVYRATSTFLLKQYFKKTDGQTPDWGLQSLKGFYEKLGVINCKMGERLKDTGAKNCTPCSSVLNVFTITMTLLFDEHLDILKELDRI